MRSFHVLAAPGAALLITLSASAATPPDAGLLQQNLDKPLPQRAPGESLQINLPDTPTETPLEGGPQVQVSGFVLEGNHMLPTDELLNLLTDFSGRQLTLGQLQAAAGRITARYRERGYPLARSYLPAQEISNGIVKIVVLEGRYSSVTINDQIGLRGSALNSLNALQPGNIVEGKSLERSLLLLQDTPGLDVRSTLRPGVSVGATDLLVDVQSAPLASGSVDMDNYGNRFVGQYRLGGTLNLNNPLKLGDRFSLQGTASNESQRYARLSYQLPLGPWASQLGVAYSDMDYHLGKDFKDLRAHGNARIASLYAIQPLERLRDFSLYAQLQFDDKRLQDNIDLFDEKSDKRSHLFSFSLNGNSRDGLFSGGLNSFSLAWSQGRLNLGSGQAKLADAATAGLQGNFNKINSSLARLQYLNDHFSLYLKAQGQWASGNLDSSEKLCLGGAYGVRAYPQGEACGDEGMLGSIELRYALNETWQLSSFVDHGNVLLNKKPWTADHNRRNLSGAGLGISWASQNWQMSAITARKIGSTEAQSDDDRALRFWAQVTRYF